MDAVYRALGRRIEQRHDLAHRLRAEILLAVRQKPGRRGSRAKPLAERDHFFDRICLKLEPVAVHVVTVGDPEPHLDGVFIEVCAEIRNALSGSIGSSAFADQARFGETI